MPYSSVFLTTAYSTLYSTMAATRNDVGSSVFVDSNYDEILPESQYLLVETNDN